MGLKALSGPEMASKIEKRFPGAIVEIQPMGIVVRSESVAEVLRFLKESPELDFNYLNSVTAADYFDFFEVVYHLTSMARKQTFCVKTRAFGRENPTVPTVTHLWQGADLQEREVYDLMGIRFSGHPNLKRIALWEGFKGHPLRRDYL